MGSASDFLRHASTPSDKPPAAAQRKPPRLVRALSPELVAVELPRTRQTNAAATKRATSSSPSTTTTTTTTRDRRKPSTHKKRPSRRRRRRRRACPRSGEPPSQRVATPSSRLPTEQQSRSVTRGARRLRPRRLRRGRGRQGQASPCPAKSSSSGGHRRFWGTPRLGTKRGPELKQMGRRSDSPSFCNFVCRLYRWKGQLASRRRGGPLRASVRLVGKVALKCSAA